jgi:hypothetical protein
MNFEGLFDGGGACNMGDLLYWKGVAERFPEFVANFYVLEDRRAEPISIGGIGSGKVFITHIIELWLPWMVNGEPCKFVAGLGENMPLTMLIGLPFQVSAKCVIDIDNLTCHLKVSGADWKLSMKIPHKKTLRSLDIVESAGKHMALPAASVTPSPAKKQKTVGWQHPGLERSHEYTE